MSTHSHVLGAALRLSKNGKLLAGVSCLALTIGVLASPAVAADYAANSDGDVRGDIQGATEPSTITLGSDVTMLAGTLPTITQPITIDTNGHTYTSVYNNGSTLAGAVNLNGTTFSAGASLILKGNFQAATAGAGANGNGDLGMFMNAGKTVEIDGTLTGGAGGGLGGNGGMGVALSGASTLTNNGAIAGGSAINGNGGTGVTASGGATFVNSGAVTGGDGLIGGGGVSVASVPNKTLMNSGTIQGGKGSTGAGGSGVTLIQGNGINNSGTIQGGDGVTGGWGVNITGLNVNNAIFNNSGTIKGGNGSGGAGSEGVIVHSNVGPMTNTGSITGGNGAAAITNTGVAGATNAPISIINSGTIAAGAGFDTAILMQPPSNLTLELHKGSVIKGNVVANSGAAINALILGGDDNASFDVSTVGPQYQNFTAYQKTGNSTWTLIGAGSVATPWTISQGTLAIGDGASIIGDVVNNATLAFTNSNMLTFANAITGTGGVNQTGSGRTNLTGASTYSGPTTVTGGTLSVNGSITSAVTVASGGTLGGNGTVGATTIQSGGNIAPGNSIGTLHINGAFAQNAGSVYQVEVDPTSNASDLILVNGTATIASGAAMNVTKNPAGNYQVGAQYTVLTALGGVNGSYALSGQAAVSQYLAVQEQQDADNIYLRVVQTSDPADAAQTGNQVQTATGTDSLPGTSNVGSAVLNTPDPGTTRSAFDALSGEAISSAKSALVSGSLLVRDTTFDRLRDVFCASDETRHSDNRAACASQSDKPAVWAQGFGSWGHVAGNGNASGLSESVGGFLVGVDMPIYDWRVGYFGGFSRTDFSVNARSSSGNSNNYHVGAYGGTQWGDLGLRLGASYSWNNLATDRSVTVGNLSNDLRANYNAGTTQVFGELGQRFGFEQFTLEPFANVAYVNLRTGGFSETGGDAALTAKANTTEDTFTTIGVRPSTDISWGSFNATARGMAGWRHAFGDVTPTSTVSFAGSDNFTVAGVPIARDSGVVEAGLDFVVHGNVSAGITYGGQFASHETDHSIRGTLAITF
ncbi:MAG TPA: autotransporter domain-containing protein [Rhizomicrobium sp.]|jgi:outer membrane autotransporter protein